MLQWFRHPFCSSLQNWPSKKREQAARVLQAQDPQALLQDHCARLGGGILHHHSLVDAHRKVSSCLVSIKINPFHPTGPFMGHQINFLNWFINVFFYILKCCFDCSLCKTRCEFYLVNMLRSQKLKRTMKIYWKLNKTLFCSQDGMS